MSQLGINDFARFFAAVNDGSAPFPWQERLARETWARLAGGAETSFLPDLLDIPTGAGKTSIIDVVTFLQALEGGLPPASRKVPRRTVFVVDRRVVVDQVDEHVKHLAQQLVDARNAEGVLGKAARSLLGLQGSGGKTPLRTASLRGGTVRDETWARRPDVPVVLSSTIDQVGSRLLFRGYGLSDSTKPLHAGLLGTDTLFVLDEVHLSVPFAETLRMLRDRYVGARGDGLPQRWWVVQLSATAPSSPGEGVFRLSAEDRDPTASPTLAQRLSAKKPAELAGLSFGVNDDGRLAKEVVQRVKAVLAGGAHKRVLVVCNRVSRAVACAQELTLAASSNRSGELHGAAVALLTGRMRPVERDAVLAMVRPVVEAGSPIPESPLILVSTQAIEAGADFDFDALVTECASIDALRQRFGRVDRLGACGSRGITARGVVLCRDAELKAGAVDPLYGESLKNTWEAITNLAQTDETGRTVLDFGAGFPEEILTDPRLVPTRKQSPLLFPQHLDAWSQTSPRPDPDPDVALWLHGLEPSDPDVNLVWRADVTAERLMRAHTQPEALVALVDSLSALPPGPSESLNLPLSHVRSWLRGEAPRPVVDADSSAIDQANQPGFDSRLALVWRGDDSTVVAANRIQPGDVLVVPAGYGGIGSLGTWSPSDTNPVNDVAEVDQIGPTRQRPVLRINDFVMGRAVPAEIADESSVETLARVRQFCRQLVDEGPQVADWPDARVRTLHFLSDNAVSVRLARDDVGWVLTSKRRASSDGAEAVSYVDESSEGSAFAAVRVSLDDHTAGVAKMARTMARNCGLPPDISDDLALAAKLHDIGKLDPRFQVMLAFPEAPTTEPLGKSSHGSDRKLRATARARAGLPDGFDHAVVGLVVLDAHPELLGDANDSDLVKHLIASHHGHCRPFARPVQALAGEGIRAVWSNVAIDVDPSVDDPAIHVDAADRFFRLRQRYGWYGLAYLEAILRLADWSRSEEEQLGEGQSHGAN